MSPEDLEEQIKTDMEKGGIRWEQREWASFHRPGQALSPMVMIITKVREIQQLNGGNPFTSHREKQNLHHQKEIMKYADRKAKLVQFMVSLQESELWVQGGLGGGAQGQENQGRNFSQEENFSLLPQDHYSSRREQISRKVSNPSLSSLLII